jgi:hypothetical protein
MTTRFAKIADGIVENIIELEDGSEYPREGLVPDPEGRAVLGGIYTSGVFGPAPVDPAALQLEYDGAIQGRIDNTARAFGFGDPNRPEISPILHAVGYADEPADPEFQAHALALRAWRSRYWRAALEILKATKAGQREAPASSEALLAELDTAAPPPEPPVLV